MYQVRGGDGSRVTSRHAQLREANSLVEEFMLLGLATRRRARPYRAYTRRAAANISVAKFTLSHFPTKAMLRCHPTPPKQNFDELIRASWLAGTLHTICARVFVGGWSYGLSAGCVIISGARLEAHMLNAEPRAGCLVWLYLTIAARSLDHAVLPQSPFFNKMMRMLTTRCPRPHAV